MRKTEDETSCAVFNTRATAVREMRLTWTTTLLAALLIAAVGAADDWPQLLGPKGNGNAAGTAIATSFSDGKPPLL